ncbi:MAG: hypothetical protein IPM98_22645 [Lewinellaceae bacterium]|nr:hypothetical protein [Lewinellaceae bacterium]
MGEGRAKRLVGTLRGDTGSVELIWFQAIDWLERSLKVGKEIRRVCRASSIQQAFQFSHPEMEEVTAENTQSARTFDPVYPNTDKLTQKGLDAKGLRKLLRTLLDQLSASDVPETLPDYMLSQYKLIGRWSALSKIHFPENQQELDAATRRLKFEELSCNSGCSTFDPPKRCQGVCVRKIGGEYFNRFSRKNCPFELTGASKRVIKKSAATSLPGNT